MARETVAQRNARFDQERDARRAQAVAEYPARLMAVLERATLLYWDLVVRDAQFVVLSNSRGKFAMTAHHTQASQEALDELTWAVDAEEQRQADELARENAREAALSKLSKEERELLGL